MPDSRPLELFGADHLGALLVIALAGAAVVRTARSGRHPERVRRQNAVLAVLLAAAYPAKLIARVATGSGLSDVVLPMHLCDWAAIAGFIALAWNHERAREILYFWGIAGTVQGLITPAIRVGFPHLSYFGFFQLHGTVVIAALYLPLGLGWRPERGAVRRVFLLGQVYLAAAALTNLLLGTNFAFLRSKPPSSLLDYLGPWPVYIVGYEVIALIAFSLLALPFRTGSSART